MNKIEIIVVVAISVLFISCLIMYFINAKKIAKKAGKTDEKTDSKKDEKVDTVKTAEQKPVPVGIIKPELQEKQTEEYDFAPLKEHKEQTKTEQVKGEVKNLSPEMKKVIMTDLLKPKF